MKRKVIDRYPDDGHGRYMNSSAVIRKYRPPKRPVGRPHGFRDYHIGLCFRLRLLGLNNKEISAALGINEDTFIKWRRAIPEFHDAYEKGGTAADGRVAHAFFRRCVGYEHDDVKIMHIGEGQIVQVPFKKRYAPDARACMNWLNNRQGKVWSSNPGDGGALPVGMLPPVLVIEAVPSTAHAPRLIDAEVVPSAERETAS